VTITVSRDTTPPKFDGKGPNTNMYSITINEKKPVNERVIGLKAIDTNLAVSLGLLSLDDCGILFCFF
jgi:hypothetical protein